jgi:hypothetical protein
MSYREHDYVTRTGTHPVGDHRSTAGSGWGLAVVLVLLVGLLGLAMMAGPADQRGEEGMTAPAMDQTAPAAPTGEITPAPAQPLD